MPANNASGKSKRPSSPYQARTASANTTSKARIWRSLAGTGFAHQRYPEMENSKAAWLKSLRLGVGGNQTPQQPLYGSKKTREQVNLALASSSDYLKHQLGFGVRNSLDSTISSPRLSSTVPGKPQYKPQEDMYDEIIELKKIIQLQKHEYDLLKAKLGYCEEENVKKEKCISQLLEEAMIMSDGKSSTKADRLILKTLKNQQIKASHQIEALQTELKEWKAKHKQLKARCKTAKSAHAKEIQKLEAAIWRQNREIKILSGEQDSGDDDGMSEDDEADMKDLKRSRFATDIKTLRASIVKTTQANCALKEDNQLLRKDLERALSSQDEANGEAAKRCEAYEERMERMKMTIGRLKQEKSEVYEENNDKNLKVQALTEEVADARKEIGELRQSLARRSESAESRRRSGSRHSTGGSVTGADSSERHRSDSRASSRRGSTRAASEIDDEEIEEEVEEEVMSQRSSASSRYQRRSASPSASSVGKMSRKSSTSSSKVERYRRNRAARKIQGKWRTYRHEREEQEFEDSVKLIQSNMRGHLQRQECIGEHESIKNMKSRYQDNYDEDIKVLQSAMRAHKTRREMIDEYSNR